MIGRERMPTAKRSGTVTRQLYRKRKVYLYESYTNCSAKR